MEGTPSWMPPDEIAWALARPWRNEKWSPTDAWRRPGDPSMWSNTPTGDGPWERIPGGWDHERCKICFERIFESADPQTSLAYHDGQDWLCPKCYGLIFGKAGS